MEYASIPNHLANEPTIITIMEISGGLNQPHILEVPNSTPMCLLNPVFPERALGQIHGASKRHSGWVIFPVIMVMS